jgi:hypothetical protein
VVKLIPEDVVEVDFYGVIAYFLGEDQGAWRDQKPGFLSSIEKVSAISSGSLQT